MASNTLTYRDFPSSESESSSDETSNGDLSYSSDSTSSEYATSTIGETSLEKMSELEIGPGRIKHSVAAPFITAKSRVLAPIVVLREELSSERITVSDEELEHQRERAGLCTGRPEQVMGRVQRYIHNRLCVVVRHRLEQEGFAVVDLEDKKFKGKDRPGWAYLTPDLIATSPCGQVINIIEIKTYHKRGEVFDYKGKIVWGNDFLEKSAKRALEKYPPFLEDLALKQHQLPGEVIVLLFDFSSMKSQFDQFDFQILDRRIQITAYNLFLLSEYSLRLERKPKLKPQAFVGRAPKKAFDVVVGSELIGHAFNDIEADMVVERRYPHALCISSKRTHYDRTFYYPAWKADIWADDFCTFHGWSYVTKRYPGNTILIVEGVIQESREIRQSQPVFTLFPDWRHARNCMFRQKGRGLSMFDPYMCHPLEILAKGKGGTEELWDEMEEFWITKRWYRKPVALLAYPEEVQASTVYYKSLLAAAHNTIVKQVVDYTGGVNFEDPESTWADVFGLAYDEDYKPRVGKPDIVRKDDDTLTIFEIKTGMTELEAKVRGLEAVEFYEGKFAEDLTLQHYGIVDTTIEVIAVGDDNPHPEFHGITLDTDKLKRFRDAAHSISHMVPAEFKGPTKTFQDLEELMKRFSSTLHHSAIVVAGKIFNTRLSEIKRQVRFVRANFEDIEEEVLKLTTPEDLDGIIERVPFPAHDEAITQKAVDMCSEQLAKATQGDVDYAQLMGFPVPHYYGQRDDLHVSQLDQTLPAMVAALDPYKIWLKKRMDGRMTGAGGLPDWVWLMRSVVSGVSAVENWRGVMRKAKHLSLADKSYLRNRHGFEIKGVWHFQMRFNWMLRAANNHGDARSHTPKQKELKALMKSSMSTIKNHQDALSGDSRYGEDIVEFCRKRKDAYDKRVDFRQKVKNYGEGLSFKSHSDFKDYTQYLAEPTPCSLTHEHFKAYTVKLIEEMEYHTPIGQRIGSMVKKQGLEILDTLFGTRIMQMYLHTHDMARQVCVGSKKGGFLAFLRGHSATSVTMVVGPDRIQVRDCTVTMIEEVTPSAFQEWGVLGQAEVFTRQDTQQKFLFHPPRNLSRNTIKQMVKLPGVLAYAIHSAMHMFDENSKVALKTYILELATILFLIALNPSLTTVLIAGGIKGSFLHHLTDMCNLPLYLKKKVFDIEVTTSLGNYLMINYIKSIPFMEEQGAEVRKNLGVVPLEDNEPAFAAREAEMMCISPYLPSYIITGPTSMILMRRVTSVLAEFSRLPKHMGLDYNQQLNARMQTAITSRSPLDREWLNPDEVNVKGFAARVVQEMKDFAGNGKRCQAIAFGMLMAEVTARKIGPQITNNTAKVLEETKFDESLTIFAVPSSGLDQDTNKSARKGRLVLKALNEDPESAWCANYYFAQLVDSADKEDYPWVHKTVHSYFSKPERGKIDRMVGQNTIFNHLQWDFMNAPFRTAMWDLVTKKEAKQLSLQTIHEVQSRLSSARRVELSTTTIDQSKYSPGKDGRGTVRNVIATHQRWEDVGKPELFNLAISAACWQVENLSMAPVTVVQPKDGRPGKTLTDTILERTHHENPQYQELADALNHPLNQFGQLGMFYSDKTMPMGTHHPIDSNEHQARIGWLWDFYQKVKVGKVFLKTSVAVNADDIFITSFKLDDTSVPKDFKMNNVRFICGCANLLTEEFSEPKSCHSENNAIWECVGSCAVMGKFQPDTGAAIINMGMYSFSDTANLGEVGSTILGTAQTCIKQGVDKVSTVLSLALCLGHAAMTNNLMTYSELDPLETSTTVRQLNQYAEHLELIPPINLDPDFVLRRTNPILQVIRWLETQGARRTYLPAIFGVWGINLEWLLASSSDYSFAQGYKAFISGNNLEQALNLGMFKPLDTLGSRDVLGDGSFDWKQSEYKTLSVTQGLSTKRKIIKDAQALEIIEELEDEIPAHSAVDTKLATILNRKPKKLRSAAMEVWLRKAKFGAGMSLPQNELERVAWHEFTKNQSKILTRKPPDPYVMLFLQNFASSQVAIAHINYKKLTKKNQQSFRVPESVALFMFARETMMTPYAAEELFDRLTSLAQYTGADFMGAMHALAGITPLSTMSFNHFSSFLVRHKSMSPRLLVNPVDTIVIYLLGLEDSVDKEDYKITSALALPKDIEIMKGLAAKGDTDEIDIITEIVQKLKKKVHIEYVTVTAKSDRMELETNDLKLLTHRVSDRITPGYDLDTAGISGKLNVEPQSVLHHKASVQDICNVVCQAHGLATMAAPQGEEFTYLTTLLDKIKVEGVNESLLYNLAAMQIQDMYRFPDAIRPLITAIWASCGNESRVTAACEAIEESQHVRMQVGYNEQVRVMTQEEPFVTIYNGSLLVSLHYKGTTVVIRKEKGEPYSFFFNPNDPIVHLSELYGHFVARFGIKHGTGMETYFVDADTLKPTPMNIQQFGSLFPFEFNGRRLAHSTVNRAKYMEPKSRAGIHALLKDISQFEREPETTFRISLVTRTVRWSKGMQRVTEFYSLKGFGYPVQVKIPGHEIEGIKTEKIISAALFTSELYFIQHSDQQIDELILAFRDRIETETAIGVLKGFIPRGGIIGKARNKVDLRIITDLETRALRAGRPCIDAEGIYVYCSTVKYTRMINSLELTLTANELMHFAGHVIVQGLAMCAQILHDARSLFEERPGARVVLGTLNAQVNSDTVKEIYEVKALLLAVYQLLHKAKYTYHGEYREHFEAMANYQDTDQFIASALAYYATEEVKVDRIFDCLTSGEEPVMSDYSIELKFHTLDRPMDHFPADESKVNIIRISGNRERVTLAAGRKRVARVRINTPGVSIYLGNRIFGKQIEAVLAHLDTRPGIAAVIQLEVYHNTGSVVARQITEGFLCREHSRMLGIKLDKIISFKEPEFERGVGSDSEDSGSDYELTNEGTEIQGRLQGLFFNRVEGTGGLQNLEVEMDPDTYRELWKVDTFEHHNKDEEQFMTPLSLATKLKTCLKRGDTVADICAGTGLLSKAAALAGCKVIAYEQDDNAIVTFRENLSHFPDGSQVDIIPGDVLQQEMNLCDVVIMNPPFHTKRTKIPLAPFIEAALDCQPREIYLVYSTTSRRFTQFMCAHMGLAIEVLAMDSAAIGKEEEIHKLHTNFIPCTLYRLTPHAVNYNIRGIKYREADTDIERARQGMLRYATNLASLCDYTKIIYVEQDEEQKRAFPEDNYMAKHLKELEEDALEVISESPFYNRREDRLFAYRDSLRDFPPLCRDYAMVVMRLLLDPAIFHQAKQNNNVDNLTECVRARQALLILLEFTENV